jgi:hypothetical protein
MWALVATGLFIGLMALLTVLDRLVFDWLRLL